MSRRMVAWGRLGASALVFAVLVWRLGTGPFLNGFRTIDGGALAAAAGLAVLSTVAYAWRWKIVAGGLGVDLSLPAAVAAYYRSMFLNATLPGGIVATYTAASTIIATCTISTTQYTISLILTYTLIVRTALRQQEPRARRRG